MHELKKDCNLNLLEIKIQQQERDEEIRRIANAIDPKLLSFLTYQDLFDDKYLDPELGNQYRLQLYDLIIDNKVQTRLQVEKYLLNFVNDMSSVLECTGYDSSTGESTGMFNTFNSIPSSYIPAYEIEHVWNSVKELAHHDIHIPFWRRYGYTLYGNGETISVMQGVSAIEFINNNRILFQRSYGDTNLAKMERSARFRDTHFDYPIYVPALSSFEERNIPNSYEESIRRHLILKEAMEGTLPEDCIVFTSSIDADGNVILKPSI